MFGVHLKGTGGHLQVLSRIGVQRLTLTAGWSGGGGGQSRGRAASEEASSAVQAKMG